MSLAIDSIVRLFYDSNWKDVITEFFPDFLELVYPELYEIVDLTKGFSFIEQEFEKLIPSNEKKGRVFNDKFVKVFLKN